MSEPCHFCKLDALIEQDCLNCGKRVSVCTECSNRTHRNECLCEEPRVRMRIHQDSQYWYGWCNRD